MEPYELRFYVFFAEISFIVNFYRVLSVIRQWVNNHWYDFEHNAVLLNDLCSFLEETDSHGKVINQYKKWCKSIKVTNFLFIIRSPFHCKFHFAQCHYLHSFIMKNRSEQLVYHFIKSNSCRWFWKLYYFLKTSTIINYNFFAYVYRKEEASWHDNVDDTQWFRKRAFSIDNHFVWPTET